MGKPSTDITTISDVVVAFHLFHRSQEGEVPSLWLQRVKTLSPLTWVEVFSWGPSPVPKAVSGVLGVQAATGVPEPSSPGAVVLDRVTVGRGRAVPGVFPSLRRQWRVYAVLD